MTLKTVAELQKLSESELKNYIATLTEVERKQVNSELWLAARRHFGKPGHSYENCELVMSLEQYNYLDNYFNSISLGLSEDPKPNRKARRAAKAQGK